MLGSKILDVAIGLIFVYIVVSILCTAVREGIEAWMKTRATYLEHGIRQLLQDRTGTGIAKQLFEHPLIFGLFTAGKYTPGDATELPSPRKRGGGLPSYIPTKTFATVLLDLAARGPAPDPNPPPPPAAGAPPAPAAPATGPTPSRNAAPISLDAVRRNIGNIGNPAVQRVLLTAVDTAQGDLDKAQKAIEDWYDSGMDRVSGWYKRSTHKILLAIGLFIAVGMNIDSVAVVGQLYKTDATREAVVAVAGNTKQDQAMSYKDAKGALDTLHLPIGWSSHTTLFFWPPPELVDIPRFFIFPWLGWILTAIAASLGAPFWFDILNKVMVIRSTVKPHEKSPEESSDDRQKPAAGTTTIVVGQGGTTAAGAPTPPAPPDAAAADATDDSIDGCDAVAGAEPTGDAQLPAAAGGVA